MAWKPKQIYKGQDSLDTGVIITETRDDNNGKVMTFHYPWMDEQPVYTIQEEPVVAVQEEPKQESRRTIKDIKDGEQTQPVTYIQEKENPTIEFYRHPIQTVGGRTIKLTSDIIDTFLNKPIGFVIDNVNDATNGGLYDVLGNKYVQGGFSLITPSRWVGTLRTGYAPWDERNTGLGSYELDNIFDTFFPMAGAGAFMKPIRGVINPTKATFNQVGNYYRVGKNLYKDAQRSGVIRANPNPKYKGRLDAQRKYYSDKLDELAETGYAIVEPWHGKAFNRELKFNNKKSLLHSQSWNDMDWDAPYFSENSTFWKPYIGDDIIVLEPSSNYKMIDIDSYGNKFGDKLYLPNSELGLRQVTPQYKGSFNVTPERYGAFYRLGSDGKFHNLIWERDKKLGIGGAAGVGLMGIGSNLPQYKKGSKIHIKKANRGKFTDYCGGTVTNECIQRGKNSSDPKIRKRATFAANARKWKKG